MDLFFLCPATTSWDEAHPGARASRPHNSWHSLGHLLHPARPATTPGPCFGRAHAVPAGRVAGCRIAGKLSGTQRDSMRAGRPRSRVAPPPITLAPQGGTRRLAGPQLVPMRQSCHARWPLRVPSCPFVDHSFFFCFRQVPPLPCRADHSKKKLPIVIEDEPRINTKTDGPPLLRRRHGVKPTRERGRPARTFLGTASAISSTRLDRQRRQDPASAEPMPFPPAGWPGAASQGN